jgi:hypothetical protein
LRSRSPFWGRGVVFLVGDVLAQGRVVAFVVDLEHREVVMNRLGAAPRQWSSPGSKKTRSPGRMISIGPPRRCTTPTPSVT